MKTSEVKRKISEFLGAAETLPYLIKELEANAEYQQKVLVDLDHYLELNHLTESERKVLTEKRLQALQLRREAKNQIRRIEGLLPRYPNGVTPKQRDGVILKSLANREYTPRAKPLADILSSRRIA